MPTIRAPSGATAREPSASGVQKMVVDAKKRASRKCFKYGKYDSVLFLEPNLLN